MISTHFCLTTTQILLICCRYKAIAYCLLMGVHTDSPYLLLHTSIQPLPLEHMMSYDVMS